ncbi:hypothetical protein CY34DRAFT_238009 [Suillus luteus UH-Slu-Lm8-n1]|uniref:Uncharacterized protein n=1 Tax=Suillus luteus UH-Slu-Lm8-n1 TaxID=930992 RepID=A0A0D0BBV2_9AGAM|nr:hypothetical protein CY34DRAFT_238009 [Suillus luteus UH-Slu-Lm8-n1]
MFLDVKKCQGYDRFQLYHLGIPNAIVIICWHERTTCIFIGVEQLGLNDIGGVLRFEASKHMDDPIIVSRTSGPACLWSLQLQLVATVPHNELVVTYFTFMMQMGRHQWH